MSRLVSRLVRMGLVTRSRSQQSSREVVVALSGKGRALVQRLIPIAKRLEQTASAGVAVRDMTEFKRMLTQIYGNLTAKRS
jgi:DNA-binding MarR family transcriptional regulator